MNNETEMKQETIRSASLQDVSHIPVPHSNPSESLPIKGFLPNVITSTLDISSKPSEETNVKSASETPSAGMNSSSQVFSNNSWSSKVDNTDAIVSSRSLSSVGNVSRPSVSTQKTSPSSPPGSVNIPFNPPINLPINEGPKVNKNDAIRYLDEVRAQFKDQPVTYGKFLEIMKEFKSFSISTAEVVNRVTSLFHGYPRLLYGFNTFLPPDYKIPVSSTGVVGTPPAMRMGQSSLSAQQPQQSSTIVAQQQNSSVASQGRSYIDYTALGNAAAQQIQYGTNKAASAALAANMSGNPRFGHAGMTIPGAGITYSQAYPNMAFSKSLKSPSSGPSQQSGINAMHVGSNPGNSAVSNFGMKPATDGLGGSTLLPSPSTISAMGALASDANGNMDVNGISSSLTTSIGNPPPLSSDAAARRSYLGMSHAVTYLRRIQQRFYRTPEVYAQFVEILRTYQKGQKDLHDVKDQVALLFQGHPDLLEEFHQFIPESGFGGLAGFGAPARSSSVASAKSPSSLLDTRSASSSFVGSTVRIGSQATGKRGYNEPDGTSTGHEAGGYYRGALRHSGGNVTARDRSQHANNASGSSINNDPNGNFVKRGRFGDQRDPSFGELEFFEKVKVHLNHNEQLYGEFLKCLNWYTLDILKKKELVRLASGFIGRSDALFTWFKNFIGYSEEKDDQISSMTSTSGPTALSTDSSRKLVSQDGAAIGPPSVPVSIDAYNVDLSTCKRLVSYRFLPKNYEHPSCSGRDTLCREVLNDTLVSCPSFNSEDSTFISSKKNIHEEALFRCEDERYELDLLIDGNQATIANFEPLVKKMSLMPARDAEKFSLSDTLGGHSETIYTGIIRKIYGSRAEEVIEAIKRTPVISVPVVLKRLKQKDEEWRMAQRDWNRAWRDVHFKNFYKSLDHQGISFKTTDKKLVAAKSLVNEIQTLYYEAVGSSDHSKLSIGKRSEYNSTNLSSPLLDATSGLPSLHGLGTSVSSGITKIPSSGLFQLEFQFSDLSVLESVLQLLVRQLAKSTAFTITEKRSIEKFLFHFLPDFFPFRVISDNPSTNEDGSSMIDSVDPAVNGEDPEDVQYMTDHSASGDVRSRSMYRHFSLASLTPEEIVKSSVLTNSAESGPLRPFLIANEHIYVFFRLLQIAFSRLSQMKSYVSSSVKTPVYFHKQNYIASFLELQKRPVDLDLSGNGEPLCNYYGILLTLLRSLVDGELDQVAFEERVRLLFASNAYLMFTFDRLLFAILKQTTLLLTDSTTEHLIALYDSFRRPRHNISVPLTPQSYTVAATSLIGEFTSGPLAANVELFEITSMPLQTQNLPFGCILCFGYRVGNSANQSTSLTVIAQPKQELESPSPKNKSHRFEAYIQEFVTAHTNAASAMAETALSNKDGRKAPPLLMVKYLKDAFSDNLGNDRLKDMTIQYHLQCKICLDTYRLAFVDNSEDFIYKPSTTSLDEESGIKSGDSTSNKTPNLDDHYPQKCVDRFRLWLETKRHEMDAMDVY